MSHAVIKENIDLFGISLYARKRVKIERILIADETAT
jgi:hypothetical protein